METLDRVFGCRGSGGDEQARAAISEREFVRSQTGIAEASPEATGRRLSASEALATFGLSILDEAVGQGQASLVPGRHEPANTLRGRREALGFSRKDLAKFAAMRLEDVVRAETPGAVSPVRTLERLAIYLSLQEDILGFREGAAADGPLGQRLKELSGTSESTRLSPRVVASLSEAAWVIAKQMMLLDRTREAGPSLFRLFEPDPDYSYPTYAAGYRLAKATRARLNIGDGEPIKKLRQLVEEKLGIPLIHAALGRRIAGATISNGSHRGIVANIEGANENVWVRRMTLAHELGHLLHDPPKQLNKLAVDSYGEIEGARRVLRDAPEIRANAFAIAFLAPPAEIQSTVGKHRDIWAAIGEITSKFGISVTAARQHVENVCQIEVRPKPRDLVFLPGDDWRADENQTTDYFPVKTTPVSRQGRFTWVVLRALELRLISLDSAASFLNTTIHELEENRRDLLQLTAPKA
jgi:Zn-dependent peptidase ImmA (M78 family)/transcriptional regulator with XRE-family HTH domain